MHCANELYCIVLIFIFIIFKHFTNQITLKQILFFGETDIPFIYKSYYKDKNNKASKITLN